MFISFIAVAGTCQGEQAAQQSLFSFSGNTTFRLDFCRSREQKKHIPVLGTRTAGRWKRGAVHTCGDMGCLFLPHTLPLPALSSDIKYNWLLNDGLI